jgi:pyruvate dehydrogenase complex dehydrogenase (E1) component
MANRIPSKTRQALLNAMLTPVVNEIQEMFQIENIMDRSRTADYVKARTFFYRYCTTRYRLTRNDLGWYTGRDHASVTHGLQSFSNISSYDRIYVDEYTSISTRLDGILNNDPDETLRDFLAQYIRAAPLSKVEEIYIYMINYEPGIMDSLEFILEEQKIETI